MSENNNEHSMQPSANNEDNNELEDQNNQNKTSIDMNTLMKNIDLNSLIKNVDVNALVSQRSNMTKNESTNDVGSIMKNMNLLSSLMKATGSLMNTDLFKNSIKEPEKTMEGPDSLQNSPKSSIKNDNADLALMTEKINQIFDSVLELKVSTANELSAIKNEIIKVKKENRYLIEILENQSWKRK